MSDWKLQHLGDYDEKGNPLPAGYYETIKHYGQQAANPSKLRQNLELLFLVGAIPILGLLGVVMWPIRKLRKHYL